MTVRFIDWIWHVRGSLALSPEQTSDDAFDRLRPLFRETGTSHERTQDTLTFRKKDQAAQDKMAVFDGGVLRIEKGAAGSVLRYQLTSRALLLCFLAPLLFLAFAQMTIALGQWQKPAAEAASTSAKSADASKKPAGKDAGKKDAAKDVAKDVVVPLNPIDKFLGAPAPEKPKKDGEDNPGRRGKKPSPTPAYVFAAIFAILYVVGRILEDRLVRALFRKRLLGA